MISHHIPMPEPHRIQS